MASQREKSTKMVRNAKLADALRANLRLRKAQARAATGEGRSGVPPSPEAPVSAAGKIDEAS